jgi:copper(I)-binding protein
MPGTPTSARTRKSAPTRSSVLASRGRFSPGVARASRIVGASWIVRASRIVRASGTASKAAASLVAVLGTCLAAGCSAPAAQAGPVIKLSSAQVSEPGASRITDIYVDVQNNGPQTKLISARLSVGGRVTLRSPVRSGQVQMRSVPFITIPAKSFVGLDPNGSHLLVTHAGPMRSGTEITLTLVFAHAGAFTVPAMVTDPQSGGSSYFLN